MTNKFHIFSTLRIIYGIIGVLFSMSSYSQRELIFFSRLNDSLSNQIFSFHTIINILFIIWIITSFLIIIGFGHRVTKYIHFFVVFYILTNQNFAFSVNESFYLNIGFWFIFINTNDYYSFSKKNNQHWELAPYLFIFFIGCQFFISGINKLLDPLWQEGYAMFYLLNLNWIKFSFFEFILEWKYVLVILNYSAIFFEIVFICMFLFKKTRIFSLLIWCGFTLLTLFLRIDYIGFLSLCILLILSSTLYDNSKFLISDLKKTITSPIIPFNKLETFTKRRTKLLEEYLRKIILVTSFILFLISIPLIIIPFSKALKNPFFHMHISTLTSTKFENQNSYKIKSKKPDKSLGYYLYRATRIIPKTTFNYLIQLNKAITGLEYLTLFNSHHILGLYGYRIIFTDDNNKEYEPLKVFDREGYAMEYSKLLTPRWLQAQLYEISFIAHKIFQIKNYRLTKAETNKINSLFKFSYSKLNPKEKTLNLRGSIVVKEFFQPVNYENRNEQKPLDWKEILFTNNKKNNLKINPHEINEYPISVALKNDTIKIKNFKR